MKTAMFIISAVAAIVFFSTTGVLHHWATVVCVGAFMTGMSAGSTSKPKEPPVK